MGFPANRSSFMGSQHMIVGQGVVAKTPWLIADRLCKGAATHVAFKLQRDPQRRVNSEETWFWMHPLYSGLDFVMAPHMECVRQFRRLTGAG